MTDPSYDVYHTTPHRILRLVLLPRRDGMTATSKRPTSLGTVPSGHPQRLIQFETS
jgi:hypothetical protein